MPILHVDNVSKSYGKHQILTNVNLTAETGQILGLIGPSGSGKTTLIKLIMGMDVPTTGVVEVLSKKVPNLDILRQIGYMAQSDALYQDLTGLENLSFFASMFLMNKSERKDRIAYVTRIVQLENAIQMKVSTYSGGMKRRLSLAIALIQNPEILILDEPTVGIDPELRKSIWQELSRLKTEEHKTIVVTTHVMDEADKCDMLTMIREGKVITTGTPHALKVEYEVSNLEEVFLKAEGVHRAH
ncbi:ABC transporter ATP-binding protein [Paenisporosarcina quisquiliarum]|uniref:ABC transporter ATP-binding protein n=1 Tax=Paenisporosarcina quisquiliarum TaxID=365346 RepID=A0A9X3LIY8_9BACL|nr:ABC transporter ATP-binding protein [Paenisporosarcina quisquiliarum]MCZ8538270.1 ABC transporter ATP-binding protein [Paenisporosarcina quisquiliarum]